MATTVFVVNYGDEQEPGVFPYDHSDAIDPVAALTAIGAAYLKEHPSEWIYREDIFSLPAELFAAHGLTESDEIRAVDWDETFYGSEL